MFKKILLTIFILSSLILGQDYIKPSFLPLTRAAKIGVKFYSYTPVIIGSVASDNLLILSGGGISQLATQTTGTRFIPQPTLTTWFNANNVVPNGMFNSNITGWTKNDWTDTLKWVSSGGGLTGALYAVLTSGAPQYFYGTNDKVILPSFTVQKGKYEISFDINLTYISPGTILHWQTEPFGITFAWSTIGARHTSYIATFENTQTFRYSSFGYYGQGFTGGVRFYVDNFTILPLSDSVQSYTKTIVTPIEDTTYYWKQSLRYTEGDGDVIYVSTPPDTVITKLRGPSSLEVVGDTLKAFLTWGENSDRELGYAIEKDTISGSSWSVVTTTAPNVTSYVNLNLIAGGQYKWRVRAVGRLSNSIYSNIATATIPVIPGPVVPTDGLYDSLGKLLVTSDGKILNAKIK
jgi:hypothetical protein